MHVSVLDFPIAPYPYPALVLDGSAGRYGVCLCVSAARAFGERPGRPAAGTPLDRADVPSADHANSPWKLKASGISRLAGLALASLACGRRLARGDARPEPRGRLARPAGLAHGSDARRGRWKPMPSCRRHSFHVGPPRARETGLRTCSVSREPATNLASAWIGKIGGNGGSNEAATSKESTTSTKPSVKAPRIPSRLRLTAALQHAARPSIHSR